MIMFVVSGFALMASAITTNKMLLAYLPATFFVALRMLAAGILLVGYHFIRSQKRHPYLKQDILILGSIAALTTFVPSVFKAFALQNMPSAKAAFLGSIDPFVTAFLAYVLYGDRLTLLKVCGILFGFIGTTLMLLHTSPTEELLKVWWIISLPELAALVAVVLQRYGWMRAQELLKAERYQPAELNGFMMMIGGLYALCAAFFMGEMYWSSIPVNARFMSLFAYTVIIGNIVSYTIYAYALKHYSVTYVSLASLSIPLFVQLYAPIILGEPITLVFFIALAINFIGLYLFSVSERRQS